MAFNFPDAPTADQEFTPSGGPTYIWKSPRWLVKPPGASAPAAHTHPESDITNLVSDLAAKAPLASPALTGVPTAPTAAALTSTTQLATTEFVTTAGNLKAPLASPALTGTPTAPTAGAGTNTTQIATTAFVAAADAATTATAAYAAKASLVDADNLSGFDSAASNGKAKWLWSVIKSTLKTYFDTLYAGIAHVGAGGSAHADVVASGASGFMTGTDKTKLDGLSGGGGATLTVLSSAATTGANTFTVTGIPAGTKQVEVMIQGVGGGSSVSDEGIRLGTSAGVEATGYSGYTASFKDATAIDIQTWGSGQHVSYAYGVFASHTNWGCIKLARNPGTNVWGISGNVGNSTTTHQTNGTKTLAGELDRIEIRSVGANLTGGLMVLHCWS